VKQAGKRKQSKQDHNSHGEDILEIILRSHAGKTLLKFILKKKALESKQAGDPSRNAKSSVEWES
jgi:hypothetical protein